MEKCPSQRRALSSFRAACCHLPADACLLWPALGHSLYLCKNVIQINHKTLNVFTWLCHSSLWPPLSCCMWHRFASFCHWAVFPCMDGPQVSVTPAKGDFGYFQINIFFTNSSHINSFHFYEVNSQESHYWTIWEKDTSHNKTFLDWTTQCLYHFTSPLPMYERSSFSSSFWNFVS